MGKKVGPVFSENENITKSPYFCITGIIFDDSSGELVLPSVDFSIFQILRNLLKPPSKTWTFYKNNTQKMIKQILKRGLFTTKL